MTERELLINWLVKRTNDESVPCFVRIVMTEDGSERYTDEMHQKVLDRKSEFYRMFASGDKAALRAFYETLSPESLIEAFDAWACCEYR